MGKIDCAAKARNLSAPLRPDFCGLRQPSIAALAIRLRQPEPHRMQTTGCCQVIVFAASHAMLICPVL